MSSSSSFSSSSCSTVASDSDPCSHPCICRFGVLSTARIGIKNCHAIQTAVNGDMRAISSRDQATADKVAAERQIPVAHGSYESLLADSTLDAIYMPIPSAMHIDWVDKVAASGKHLLCDKPVGINADEVTRILESCRKHNILFMDGVMFMHHPRLAYMHRVLHDSSIMGEIRSVHTEFAFPCKLRPIPKNEYAGETGDAKSADDPASTSDKPQYENIRLNPDLEPLGALGDLAYYNIRFTLWAMNYAIPTAVSAHIMYDTPAPGTNKSVPLDISATIFYSNNRMATFVASFTSQFRQNARITGTKGNIHIDDFVLANYDKQVSFIVNQSTGLINGRVDETATKYLINYTRAQEVAMFESFAGQVTSHQQGNKTKTSIFKYGEPHPINNVHAPEINIHQGHHQTLQMINHDDSYTAEQWRDGWESVKLANGHHMSWANITLLTTCVMDACLASNARDGAKVPLKYTPFD